MSRQTRKRAKVAGDNAGSIRILLVDDHEIVREGVRKLIEEQPDLSVVDIAADGRSAVKQARDARPDVVIMDVAMREMNGIEATRQIAAEMPEVKVLCLSMHAETRFVAAMLEAGARGYVLKKSAAEQLVQAVRRVAAGETYLCPEISGVVVNDYVRRRERSEQAVFSKLSDREREVLQLLAEGSTTKEIAASLHLSVKTIGTHREHIMEKLGTRSIAELTRYALREGLSEL